MIAAMRAADCPRWAYLFNRMSVPCQRPLTQVISDKPPRGWRLPVSLESACPVPMLGRLRSRIDRSLARRRVQLTRSRFEPRRLHERDAGAVEKLHRGPRRIPWQMRDSTKAVQNVRERR